MNSLEVKPLDPIEMAFEQECEILWVKPEDRDCYWYKTTMSKQEIQEKYPELLSPTK